MDDVNEKLVGKVGTTSELSSTSASGCVLTHCTDWSPASIFSMSVQSVVSLAAHDLLWHLE